MAVLEILAAEVLSCFESNLRGRSHVGSLFTKKSKKRLARDVHFRHTCRPHCWRHRLAPNGCLHDRVSATLECGLFFLHTRPKIDWKVPVRVLKKKKKSLPADGTHGASSLQYVLYKRPRSRPHVIPVSTTQRVTTFSHSLVYWSSSVSLVFFCQNLTD